MNIGLYIVLGVLAASVLLLMAMVLKSRKWKLRLPFRLLKPKKKRKVAPKKKKLPVVQITFNKR